MLYILCSFHRGTMENRRYSLNNQSNPSSTTSSGTSSTPSTPSSPAPAGNSGSGMKIPSASPGLLLGLSGGWLLARMFLFGGALWPIEAIAILVADGFAYTQGGKGQKKLALLIMALAGINLFFPGFNQGVKNVRETQINPPAPIEQVAPPIEEAPPSTERIVVSGKKITLTGDGTYSVPKGKKSLCFTNLGMKDGSSNKSQYLTINGVEYISLGTECHDLPENLEGKVVIDFFPDKEYGTPEGVRKLYAYWKSQPGGQSELPIIRLGE